MQRCEFADEQVARSWKSLVIEAHSAGFQHSASARLLRSAIAACRPVALAFDVQHAPAGHRKIAEQCGAGYMAQVRAYEDLLSAPDGADQEHGKATLLLKSCNVEMRLFMRSVLKSWLHL
jgi:hypothetical protein